MWVVTTQGFDSIVEHRDDPDCLIVRARTRQDVEALRTQIPSLAITEDPNADYRWRALVSRADWSAAAAELAAAIDYPNFKNAVAERQGHDRASIYMRVWAALLSLQEGGS